MTQTIVLGVINGLTIGLLAVGIVLVYKANRFINLGHGQLGTLSAVLLAKFVLDWGLPWALALVLAVGVGVGVGLGIERWVIRPLRARAASSETLLLASIGIAQLLLALVFVSAFRPDDDALSIEKYPLPFDSRVELGSVVLTADHLLILAVVPVLVVALGAFLRYSLMGKMIRAVASNTDAARLCGVSVRRVSAVTWGIAGALSAVTAVLLAPSQGSFDAAQLGPDLLLRALGAAAVGGFVSVPAACLGGLGLGVVEQVARHQTSSGADATLVLFAAIIVVFVIRARAINRAAAVETPVSYERRPLRVPAGLADHVLVRRRRLLLAAGGLALAAVAPFLPYLDSAGNRFKLALIVVYALVGVALTMLVGWAGQVSLGHFALVGVGAFITARLAPNGWSLLALLVLSGLAGAAAMAVTGLPAVRLRGLTMVVTTLGVAVVAPVWLFRQDWFGSAQPFGLTVEPAAIANGLGRPFEPAEVYFFALAWLAAVLVGAGLLRDSVPGRLVQAVRDNEQAAASFGVTPSTVKLGVLAVSGFVAGSAGVIWAEAMRNVATHQFSPAISLSILAVPVIGGMGSLAGAVVGAVAVFAPAFFLGPVTEALFGEFSAQVGFQLALGGVGLVAVVLAYPSGIAGAAQRSFERLLERLDARRPDEVRGESSPPLVTTAVGLSFGGLRALDDVSVRVEPGEIVGLIGPNGAGKTTLLNAVSGALRADKGSIEVFGEEVVDLPAEYRAAFGVARSFQNARLFPGLTVTETVQVALAGRNRVGFVSSAVGAPWARALNRGSRREALELLERLNLTPWADALTSDLSTGTRRICDLAAQVASRPRLLLLDEPTAGVAQRECEMFPPLLRRIRDELDCAILLVEHDMPMLMSLCDRVYAMEAGRVIAEGTPAEVRADPLVVASYLGTDETAINRSGGNGNGRRRRQLVAARP
jgi:ABC-type branched-subunit amino acid transport system ATPase component/ABC-type branched-subunit amino acid transport system permease subunit